MNPHSNYLEQPALSRGIPSFALLDLGKYWSTFSIIESYSEWVTCHNKIYDTINFKHVSFSPNNESTWLGCYHGPCRVVPMKISSNLFTKKSAMRLLNALARPISDLGYLTFIRNLTLCFLHVYIMYACLDHTPLPVSIAICLPALRCYWVFMLSMKFMSYSFNINTQTL